MSESVASAGTPAPVSSSQGAVCPGNKALFDASHEQAGYAHYLRAAFTVYWQDASPSTEIFYLAGFPLKLHPKGIAAVEAEVLSTIRDWDETQRAQAAIMVTYMGVQMSEQDVEDAGWRMIPPPGGMIGDPVPNNSTTTS